MPDKISVDCNAFSGQSISNDDFILREIDVGGEMLSLGLRPNGDTVDWVRTA